MTLKLELIFKDRVGIVADISALIALLALSPMIFAMLRDYETKK